MPQAKALSDGPQALAVQAQYLLNQRRLKVWIPFLERKIEELQARIQEKQAPGEG